MEKKEKKVIIGLWGPQGRGKTTTLRKLALEFLDSPEVKEDIQIGFLYNKERPTKVVVSTTTEDAGVNTDFYTGLTAQTLILTATRIKDETVKINEVPKLVKKEDPDPEQEKIDDNQKQKIKERIEPIAKESSTLHQFSRKLLASDVVEGDIQIAFPYKGKRIVISTAGDDSDTVEEGAYLFKTLEADILVTATRTEGGSVEAFEAFEEDDIGTKAIWIYKSYLTYSELNRGKKGKPLKESITKEQIEIIRNTINEQQAKILKATIDLIIDKWEEQSEDNSSSSDPVTE